MSMKRIRSQTKTFKVIQKRTLRNFSKRWSYETFWNEPSYGLVDASRTAGVDTRWDALTRLHSRREHQYYSLEHSERSPVRLLQGLGARRDFIKEIKQRREIIFFKPLSIVRKPQEKKPAVKYFHVLVRVSMVEKAEKAGWKKLSMVKTHKVT